jgi:hypothetical protein
VLVAYQGSELGGSGFLQKGLEYGCAELSGGASYQDHTNVFVVEV